MVLQFHHSSWLNILLVFGAVSCDTVRYDDHKLYAISLDPLRLPSRIDREIHRHIILDHDESENNLQVTVLVEPHKSPAFESLLNNNSISHAILNTNFQRMIDDESKNIKPLIVSATDFGWKNFFQLETIHEWLDHLAENHSDLITSVSIGTSHEGRPLKGVKLSYKKDNTAVFIEAGIHAKEWISPATATFFLNQLLTSTDPRVRNIARNFDWIVVPVTNPDGYKYTFDGDRLWRKNRQKFGTCVGVDLNRNWNSSWKSVTEGEDSSGPCGPNYPGPYAFSAPETRNLAAYLRSNVASQRIQTYLSFHCAAQKLLFPYAGKGVEPANNNDLQRIGDKAIEALGKRDGTRFQAGGAYHIMYEAPGTSIDWIYDELNVPIVYTYELRRSKVESENFQDRFLLPVDQIEAAAWETLDSVIALLDEAETLGYYKLNISSSMVISYCIGLSILLVMVLTGVYFGRKYRICSPRRPDDRNYILYNA